MFRRCATLCGMGSGPRGVAQDMIAVWRLYGDRIGEVHANIEGLHWSVDDKMLDNYFEQFGVKTRTCVVQRDPQARRGVLEAVRRRGKSLGTAAVVFRANQSRQLAKLFGTRHILQGKELRLSASDDQPKFNFYIPNTAESDAEGMDPNVVHNMAQQVSQLGLITTGKFANPKLRHLMKVKDEARTRIQKERGQMPEPPNKENPWFYGMGEETWDDLGEAAPRDRSRDGPYQKRGSDYYRPHWEQAAEESTKKSKQRPIIQSATSDLIERAAREGSRGLEHRVDLSQSSSDHSGGFGRKSKTPKNIT